MRIRFPLSIRSKLVLLGIMAFLPVVLLLVFNFLSHRRLETAEAHKQMEKVLKFALLHEEQMIREASRILATLADNAEVLQGGSRADEVLSLFQKSNPEYVNIVVARLDGRVIAGRASPNEHGNVSGRACFRNAVGKRAFAVGEYEVAPATGKTLINFGYPLHDRPGTIGVVLCVALDLSRLTEFGTEVGVQIPEGASYVKVDNRGMVVSAYPKTETFATGHRLERSLFERISREKEGAFRTTGADGVKRLFLFSPFRSPFSENKGYVFLGIPIGALYSHAEQEFSFSIAILSVVMVLLLAVIWLGGTALIIRPLAVVVDKSKRLAAGDLAVRSGLGSAEGELGQLGRAFDEMASELQRQHDRSCAMQESLRETTDYLESLLRYANAPIIVWDSAFRITRFNGAFERLTGFPADEIVGRKLHGLFPESGREESLSEIARISGGQRWESVEIPVLCRNGGVRIVLWNSANIYAKDGATLIATIAQGQDITERKHAEAALKASESKYRLLIENASEAIFILQDELVKYSNPTTGRITGLAADCLGSTPFVALVHPDDRQMVREKQELRLQGGGLSDIYSFRLRNQAGEELWVELNSALIEWEGRPATLNFARDITPQKKLETELLASQKMEAVGRLAGGVAHDFNNLLTVILGYSQLLCAKFPEGEESRREAEEIQRAAELAQGLARQLLAFSRRQILQPRVININSVVSEMEQMIRHLIGENIQLETRLGRGLWNVRADKGQMEQVVMNIAVNARDAMPGGGKVTIETANVSLDGDYCRRRPAVQPGRYVLLAISDTGVGMDGRTASKVFDPFFTTKGPGKGTGLGLSTVYGIVKQSGGFIWVYSEPGWGATFKVYLPRTETAADVPDAPERVVEDLRGEGTVLIAEDEESIRTLAANILGGYGYPVLSAGDGEEALRVAGTYEGEIGLLLTDVVMPKVGGKEVYERLRRLRPGIRVLYMSGYTENAIVHHGVLDTGVDFLQKPFSPVHLARKVKEVLSRK